MKRLLPVLLAIGGLVLGTSVGYLLAPPEPKPQPHIADLSPAPQTTPRIDDKPPLAKAPTKIPPASDLGAWLAAIDVPTVKPGDGVISGTVFLESGLPLAGVEVSATPHIPTEKADLSFEQELEAFARRRAIERAGRQVARTDATGAYRLTGLDASAFYALTATLAGHDIKPAGRFGAPVQYYGVDREVHFVAKVAVNVTVDLRLPDGTQPDKGQIGISDDLPRPTSTHYWYWTPSDPTRAFEPGDWKLTARAGEAFESAAAPHSLRVVAGEPVPTVTIHVTPKPAIVGKVTFPAGTEEMRIFVELQKQEDGVFATMPRSALPVYQSNPALLWSYMGVGRFQFLDLAPGEYRLILLDNKRPIETRDLSISSGVTNVEFTVPEPNVQDYVVVRATGPDGPIVEGMHFLVARQSGQGGGHSGVHAVHRGEGEYWISRSEIEQEDDVTRYTLHATSREHGKRELEFDPAAEKVLEVSFGAPTFLVVEILGFDDHANRAELRVQVWKSGAEPDRRSYIGQDPQQSSKFGPLEPGSYEVALIVEHYGPFERYELDRASVHLAQGTRTIQLTAPELCTFTVLIPQEHRAAQLTIRHVSDPQYLFRHGGTGDAEWTVTKLKPGDYEVSDRNTGSVRVSIPAMAGQKVEFKPQPFNAVRLVPSPIRRNAADIGLKSGDIVIEANGKSLEDEETRKTLISKTLAGETATWVVLRAGARTTVTFKSSEWSNAHLRTEPTRVD